MEFNIRAISLAESIASDARVAPEGLLGTEIEFRQGIRLSLSLPQALGESSAIVDPAKTLTVLSKWSRVFKYPEPNWDTIHVLATAEDGEGDIVFYRADFRQPPSRRGRRPPVQLVGTTVANYDECASWLVELAHSWEINRDPSQRRIALWRPRPIPPAPLRVACVCPALLGARAMAPRLVAIGRVFGAEIVLISPRSYHDVQARLAGALPLDSVVISRYFAPYISDQAVPDRVSRDLIHFCDSDSAAGIEEQVSTWITLSQQAIESQKVERQADGDVVLLAVMLQGMLSHSKIGQFNHCPRATVLKRVRAAHLNAAAAEDILDENCEPYEDTKTSDVLFLWKPHNDGAQYFLNVRCVERIRLLVSEALSPQ
jgi:hypothetical protein